MFANRRRLGRLEEDAARLKCELAELHRRIDVLEAEKERRDDDADKAEKLYMEGLSNVMNYDLAAIRKTGEKLGG